MSAFKRFGRTYKQGLFLGLSISLPLGIESENMAIFNLGSINIDLVYRVSHFPAAGETLTASSFMQALGGKGANQSIAVAAAGAKICHIGAANPNDGWLFTAMAQHGVDMTFVQESQLPTGHAIVTVNDEGENQILLHPGANRAIDINQALSALNGAEPEDWVLLQNETNGTLEFAKSAKARGLKVAYSAAPFEAHVALALLPHCDLLIINEGESAALAAASGKKPEELDLTHLVITRGSAGAFYFGLEGQAHQPAFAIEPVDTTGAGDCFFGYFLAGIAAGERVKTTLRLASAAAAMQVTKAGAATATPLRANVLAFAETH